MQGIQGVLARDVGTPPPYFGVTKHKKTCFGSELDGYSGVFAPIKGSKIGYDITPTRILIRVLKIGEIVVQTPNASPKYPK